MAQNEEDLIDLRSNPSTDSSVADLALQTSLLDIQDSTGHTIQPSKVSTKGELPVKNYFTDNKIGGTPYPALAVKNYSTYDKPDEPARSPKPASRRKYAWDEIICIAHNTTPVSPVTTRMMQLGLFYPGDRIPRHIAKPPPGSTIARFYRNEVPEYSDTSQYIGTAQIARAVQDFRDDLQTATASVPTTTVTADQAWDLVLNKRCAEHQGGSVAPDVAVASSPSSSRPGPPGRAVSIAPGQGSSALAKFFPAHYFEDSPPASPVVGSASTTTRAAAADDWWSTPWPA